MRKMFYLLKYNHSRITQARDKQVEDKQDQSMKGCSHDELDKDNYQQYMLDRMLYPLPMYLAWGGAPAQNFVLNWST